MSIWQPIGGTIKNGNILIEKQDVFDLSIYDQPNIYTLRLKNCRFDSLPEGISKLKNLLILQIENTPITSLPSDIHLLEKLQQLILHKTKLSKLPDNLAQLKSVYQLYLTNSKLTELPDFLTTWAYLCRLDISDNPISIFPKILFRLSHLYYCKCRNMSIFHENFRNFNQNRKFFKAINRRVLPENIVFSMYKLASNDVDMCKDLPVFDLLESLVVGDVTIKTTALQILEARAETNLQQKPLQKGSCIALVGKIQQEKEALKNQLEVFGIDIEARISKKVTHLLIGNSLTPAQREQMNKTDKPFLFVPQLTQFFQRNEAYFLVPTQANASEETEEQANNLFNLLMSNDEPSIMLALEIIHQNGLPKSLITAVFIIAKNGIFNTNINQQARLILERNASPALVQKLKTSKTLNFDYGPNRNMNFFLSDTNLDWRVLMEYSRRHNRFDFRYEFWFDYMSEAELKAIYLDLLKNPDFTLYLDLLKAKTFKLLISWQHPPKIIYSENTSLPKFAYLATQLQSLTLKNMYRRKAQDIIDEVISAKIFLQLTELVIFRCNLFTLPDCLYSCTHIKTIKLEGNHIPIETIDATIFDISDYQTNKILTRI